MILLLLVSALQFSRSQGGSSLLQAKQGYFESVTLLRGVQSQALIRLDDSFASKIVHFISNTLTLLTSVFWGWQIMARNFPRTLGLRMRSHHPCVTSSGSQEVKRGWFQPYLQCVFFIDKYIFIGWQNLQKLSLIFRDSCCSRYSALSDPNDRRKRPTCLHFHSRFQTTISVAVAGVFWSTFKIR